MNFKMFSWKTFILVTLIMSNSLSNYGQENLLIQKEKVSTDKITSVNLDTYEEVLDLLFPGVIAPFPYGYVLRFQPSFGKESQIVVNNNFSDIKVEVFESPDGNIREQIDALFERGIEDSEEMAKQIRIEKRIVKITPEIAKRWRESFYKNLGLVGFFEGEKIKEDMKEVGLKVDGTSYSIWYKGQSDLSFEFWGGSEPDASVNPNDNPMVNWMKQIKREISTLPTTNKQPDKSNGIKKTAIELKK